jgi:hypothetical protein
MSIQLRLAPRIMNKGTLNVLSSSKESMSAHRAASCYSLVLDSPENRDVRRGGLAPWHKRLATHCY